MQLSGKTALITGAGSGLGRAIALALAREGADIAVNDVHADAAGAVIEEARALGRRAIPAVGDVSDSAVVAAFVAEAAATLGTLDILVNNAGILQIPDGVQERVERMVQEVMSGGTPETPLLATQSLTDADWSRMLAVHLNGTFYCTRETLKVMEPKRSGVIINIASIAGTTGIAAVPHYSAAKGGIIAFTKAVARELVRAGIRVNAVAPGYCDTPLLDPISQVMKFATVAQIPMGRFGTAEEVAGTVVYLASDASAFMTGQVLSPNGGEVI